MAPTFAIGNAFEAVIGLGHGFVFAFVMVVGFVRLGSCDCMWCVKIFVPKHGLFILQAVMRNDSYPL